MPGSPITKVVDHLRNTVLQREDEDALSDGQLLSRFLDKRDEDAFAALVRRHGPMVWGVCRRIVGHTSDAEDAFQAAFLILVRKAAAVEPREAVGNWLYGVACLTAMKARTTSARVRAREKQVTNMPEPAKRIRDDQEELQILLDRELSALPDKYRLAVVLCDLEGRTRRNVAAQLNIPEGTLSSRLVTAHRMLARRLARHGLAVSGGSLAALLAQNAASAGVPASVAASTIKTATLVAACPGAAAGLLSANVAALMEGGLKVMLLTKLKIATVLLVCVILGAGAATYTLAVAEDEHRETIQEKSALVTQPQEDKPKEKRHPARKTDAKIKSVEGDKEKLQGTWRGVAMEREGKALAAGEVKKFDIELTIDGDEFMLKPFASKGPEHFPHGTFTVDPTKQPRWITMMVVRPLTFPVEKTSVLGLYELDGDTLKLLQSRPDQDRPPEFKTTPKSGLEMIVFQRVVPAAPAAKAGEKPEAGEAQKPLDPEILAQLAAQLQSENWEKKSVAVLTVTRLLAGAKEGANDFRPLVEPLFRSAGWGGIAERNARMAEDSLVRIGGQATPFLRQRLQSPDAHDRRVAAELLVRIGPPDAALVALLRPLLADRDDYVRKAAIDGLGILGAISKAAIDDLEEAATHDPILARRVGARIALIRVAGASAENVRALAAFLDLRDDAKGVRDQSAKEAAVYAASALGELGPKARAAQAQLLAALKNPDLGSTAAHTLGQIGADAPEAITWLINRLQNDPERDARRSAAGSLGTFGPAAKAAIPALRAALKADGNGGWWVAADALGKIGGPEVVPILMEALVNPDDDIRLTSMRGLGNLGAIARPALKALETARQQDPRESNRVAAAEALRKIEREVSKMK